MTSATTPPTIALMAPGDMGHAVGATLRQHGLRVITCLEGRSQRTRDLAAKADIEPVATEDELVRAADMLLSILVPAEAENLARRMAAALERTASTLLYVDFNAIAPQTTRRIGTLLEVANADFVDGGIIGPPPRGNARAVFYTSGSAAAQLTVLRDFGLDVRQVSEQPGDASALKMCYAALTKGTTAVMTELALAAARLGVTDALRAELEQSQQPALANMMRAVPAMVPKAHRWVGEMEEIAATFEGCGLTPKVFAGAAELYDLVAHTPLGASSPEEWRQQATSFEDVVTALADAGHQG